MPRIEPLTPVVDLSSRKGELRFRSRVADPVGHTLAIDMYSHLRESHPETHVGYWVFSLPKGQCDQTIALDLATISRGSVWRVSGDGAREEALDCWFNPNYVFDPLIGIQLVLRKGARILENRFVTGKVADAEVLRSYYRRVHSGHGYAPLLSEPFLFELHASMLKLLERLFLTHIVPGGRVLDAGCGRSLFTEIRPDWPFEIVAADVDHGVLASRQASFPAVRWVAAGAVPLPFRSQSFDALFAGELIEHLVDPQPGLAEFARVLRPGGTLILTTPNSRRLANLVDNSLRPYSPDHLSELSYDEVRGLLSDHGFEIVRETARHLELFLNWLSPMPKLDKLQRRWNRPWAVPLMRLMLPAGALFPRYAVDLVFVAKRR